VGLQETKIESLPFVIAELNYLAPTPGKPRTYAFDPPPGEPKTAALPEPHQVPIFDARLIAEDISLDREGFALVRHPTRVRNFYDDREVKSVYYPAAEAFIRATLKADRVFIFDHTVRKRVEDAPDLRGAGPRQPATRVHVYQTTASGPNRVREHLPDEAEELLKGRVQVINLWRPRSAMRRWRCATAGPLRPRSHRLRSDLSQPARRDLLGEVQSEPSLVLFPGNDRGRGAVAEVLRFRDRRADALRAAHRLRRSYHASGRAAARKHRAAYAGVSQELSGGHSAFQCREQFVGAARRGL
jgi:hypothetical protein